ncbi:MAG TPA: hypothetical protein VLM85_24450 [Polyangiaceae bacterium]|nr:hypothetical protein [Polyangiaceae bacterium]
MRAIASSSAVRRGVARSNTLVALALSASGCDPGWNVSGHVIDALGAPVGGATLTVIYLDASIAAAVSSAPRSRDE